MAEQITAPEEEVELRPGLNIPMGGPGRWWRVLEVDTERMTALVLAEESIKDDFFHSRKREAEWRDCSLRTWLNTKFLREFSPLEQAAVLESEISNPGLTQDGQAYTTRDRLFLLGADEARQFLKRADREYEGVRPWWWLRSVRGGRAMYVLDGGVRTAGRSEHRIKGGVRPAFRADLRSDFFRNASLSEKDGVLTLRIPQLSISGTRVLGASKSAEHIAVPEGITELDSFCFFNSPRLRSVSLPKTLQKIGEHAFSFCPELGEVLVPYNAAIAVPDADAKKVKTLSIGLTGTIPAGPDAAAAPVRFAAGGAEEIIVPEGVTELGEACFAHMKRLRRVTLPATLQKVGKRAFVCCDSLQTIEVRSDAIEWDRHSIHVCENLQYTAEMLRNMGPLPSDASGHLDAAGPAELACLILYQKDIFWGREVYKRVAGTDVTAVLSAITEHIAGLSEEKRKAVPAERVERFILRHSRKLDAGQIGAFCRLLSGAELRMFTENAAREHDTELLAILLECLHESGSSEDPLGRFSLP